MLVHSGKKDFQCHVCGNYFGRKGDMKRHYVTHTNEKNFKCDQCDKSFTAKRNVKTHVISYW